MLPKKLLGQLGQSTLSVQSLYGIGWGSIKTSLLRRYNASIMHLLVHNFFTVCVYFTIYILKTEYIVLLNPNLWYSCFFFQVATCSSKASSASFVSSKCLSSFNWTNSLLFLAQHGVFLKPESCHQSQLSMLMTLRLAKHPNLVLCSQQGSMQGLYRSCPWLKFLWESYRTLLEVLKNNAHFEVTVAQKTVPMFGHFV